MNPTSESLSPQEELAPRISGDPGHPKRSYADSLRAPKKVADIGSRFGLRRAGAPLWIARAVSRTLHQAAPVRVVVKALRGRNRSAGSARGAGGWRKSPRLPGVVTRIKVLSPCAVWC